MEASGIQLAGMEVLNVKWLSGNGRKQVEEPRQKELSYLSDSGRNTENFL